MMTFRYPLITLLCLFFSIQGCTPQKGATPLSTAPDSDFELGVIRGALTLPTNQNCQRFVAESLDTGDDVFSIDIEQARVRNHQYSFLHHLAPESYETRGRLECDEETFYSLPARFVVNQDEETQVQYRFFFDVESDLNQVDLLFCAELLLAQVAPIEEACIEEPIQLQYDIDWLREDCGNVYLQLNMEDREEISPAFAFPDESTTGMIEAPSLPGVYTLKVGLTSQRNDLIPLAEFIYDVDLCEEDSIDNPEDPTVPVDPVDPVDPEDPVDPVDPEDPVDPAHCPIPQSINVEISDVVLSTITLDGSASQGVDGLDISEYYWTVVQRPEGSTSSIKENVISELEDDPSTPTASFFLDLVGDYVIELNVIDIQGNDSSDELCRGHQIAINAYTDQEIHVQLTWTTPDDPDEQDDRGTDLDLHLLHPSSVQWNSEFDCHWRRRTGEWGPEGDEGNASLDIDDVNGAGPENINVYRPEETDLYQSDYRIGVYLYNQFVYDLMEARVRVYLNGDLSAEYEKDLTMRGQLWEPAGIMWSNGEGDLIEIDRFYEEVDLNTQTRSMD